MNPLTPENPREVAREGSDGVPFADYVRVVSFPDRNPQAADEAPIHMATGPVLFDGVVSPARIAREGITIDIGAEQATVVTMHVYHEDVQIGTTDPDAEEYVPHLIGGRHVLTPVGKGWDWVPLDESDPLSPIVCSMYVAEVHIS